MDQSAWTADVVRKYRVRQPRNCPSAPLRRAAAPCRLLRPRAQDRGGTDRARGCRSSSAHGAPDSAQDQRGRPQDGPEALSNPERHERLPSGRPRPRPPCPSRRTDRIRWTHPAGSWRSGGAPGLRTEDLRAAPWCPGSSSSRRAGRRGRARAHRGQGGPRGAIGARQGRPARLLRPDLAGEPRRPEARGTKPRLQDARPQGARPRGRRTGGYVGSSWGPLWR